MKHNEVVCQLEPALLFFIFRFENLISGPKSYRDFRETGSCRADKSERVRAKRCDAVDWDSAQKCRLFSTLVRACDVVCPLDAAAVTELWRLDLFSCTSSSFLCAGTLSPRGKCCYFLREVSWSRQTSLSKGFSYYFHDSPMSMLFQNKNN